jgi:hypothetical protein
MKDTEPAICETDVTYSCHNSPFGGADAFLQPTFGFSPPPRLFFKRLIDKINYRFRGSNQTVERKEMVRFWTAEYTNS